MRNVLKFFAVKALYELLQQANWREAADRAEVAVVQFDRQKILYANQVFKDIVLKDQNQPLEESSIETVFAQQIQAPIEQAWNLVSFDRNVSRQAFFPIFIDTNHRHVADDTSQDLTSEFEVLCVHPAQEGQQKSLVAIWLSSTSLPKIAVEESRMIQFLSEGLYHVVRQRKEDALAVQFVSPSFAELLAEDYEALISKLVASPDHWCQYIFDRDREQVQKQLLAPSSERHIEYRIQRQDGLICWVRQHQNSVTENDEGEIDIYGRVEEITDYQVKAFAEKVIAFTHDALSQTSDAESLFNLLCEYWSMLIPLPLIWWGESDEAQQRVFVKQACGEAREYAIASDFKISLNRGEAEGRGPTAQAWFEGVGQNDNTLTTKQITPWRFALEHYHLYSSYAFRIEVDGQSKAVFNLYSDQPSFFVPEIQQSLVMAKDLIENGLKKWALEARLRQLTYYSDVTGDPNGRSLQERLPRSMQYSPFSLVMLKPRRFSEMTAVWGEAEAKRLAQEMSKQLHEIFGEEDKIYHLGAATFILWFQETDVQFLTKILQNTHQQLEQRVHIAHSYATVRFRSLIFLFPNKMLSPEHFLETLVVLRYQSQVHDIEQFKGEVLLQIKENSRLQNLIEQALQNNRLGVSYLPIIHQDGKVIGMEVLAQLRDTQGHILPPADWLKVADESGLMPQVTHALIEQVLTYPPFDLQKKGASEMKIVINLSAADILNENFLTWIGKQWLKHQVYPEQFVFEVSEQTIMDYPDESQRLFEQLVEVGAEVSIDNYGRHGAALEILRQPFPFRWLEMDVLWAHTLLSSEKTSHIVSSLIQLAHQLGLKVKAEGVETRAQFQALKALGVDALSGFYISKPLSLAESRHFRFKQPKD